MASSNAIAFCGGVPEFADIDKFLCLSPASLEKMIELHGVPKVVVPVDFAGHPADLPGIKQLADQYGFRIVEDAAHAMGSRYAFKDPQGEDVTAACGSCRHSDLAIYSFHPVKTITTGEGGMVCTNHNGLANKCRQLSSHGIVRDASKYKFNRNRLDQPAGQLTGGPGWYHEMHALGYNYRITDIQCALGISQLRKLEGFKQRRQAVVKYYNQAFSELAGNGLIELPPWKSGSDPCFHLYIVQTNNRALKGGREAVYLALREKGIMTQVHYIPIYLQPWYRKKYGYAPGKCPEAERFYYRCLSLPLYPSIGSEEVEKVVQVFEKTVKKLKR